LIKLVGAWLWNYFNRQSFNLHLLTLLFDFPDTPREKGIEEICGLHHAHRPIHISGQVTHFVFGVLPGWLAWFRVLTCGSTASSRAGVEIEFIVRTVPVAGDRSAKVLSC
ncbi:hypothetical protein, partial [Pseudomonas lactis]|uniref:hypothetical protein n=1 Tax=Pseudomonas lactis TaxID=1615674 RepID=UPI001CA456C6